MIRPIEIRERLRKTPFQPFKIFCSDGKVYEISHPEQAWVTWGSVWIQIPDDAESKLPPWMRPGPVFDQGLVSSGGHVAQVSVLLITRLEVHESEQPS